MVDLTKFGFVSEQAVAESGAVDCYECIDSDCYECIDIDCYDCSDE